MQVLKNRHPVAFEMLHLQRSQHNQAVAISRYHSDSILWSPVLHIQHQTKLDVTLTQAQQANAAT